MAMTITVITMIILLLPKSRQHVGGPGTGVSGADAGVGLSRDGFGGVTVAPSNAAGAQPVLGRKVKWGGGQRQLPTGNSHEVQRSTKGAPAGLS